MLDARIASALNKVIQNSHFKKKVSLEEQKAQKEDRFLRGRQIAYMIHDYFRVTGEWLEEFKGNLVDESVPEHRHASSSSHELPSEPRAQVVYRVSKASSLTSRRTEIAISA